MPACRRVSIVVAAALITAGLALSGCSVAHSVFGSSSAATAAASSDGGAAFIGQKIAGLNSDLERLSANVTRDNRDFGEARLALQRDTATYNTAANLIEQRLEAGTTPNNAELGTQQATAQAALGRLDAGFARLTAASNETAADFALATYLGDAARATAKLQGPTAQDRLALTEIERRAGEHASATNQLSTQIALAVEQHRGAITNERTNLALLTIAIRNGGYTVASLNGGAAPPGTKPLGAAPPIAPAAPPLVTIRFDHPGVRYQDPLYAAVSAALKRRPSATFAVVAVAPTAGSAAEVATNAAASKHNAENVLRALNGMGLPAERIALSAITSPAVTADEIRLYVR